MQAVADTESGTDAFSTIITNAAQYQLNDVRSIKKDSFELAMRDARAQIDAMSLLGTDEEEEKIVQRPQTKRSGIFYLMYEAKSGANFSIFNVNAAKEVKKVEALATGREDFKEYCLRFDNDKYPACRTVDWSPLRFLYASEFNVHAAKAVIAQLKKPEVMEAHKMMGPCVDAFHMMTPPALWPDPGIDIHHHLSAAAGGNMTASDSVKMMSAMFRGRSCNTKNALTNAQEQASWGLSQLIVGITMKFDGKGKEPVQDMATLANFVALIKELPSQAMFVDFHLDNKFNTNNSKCKFTRSILPFGGPLDRVDKDGVRLYMNTSQEAEEQEKKLRKYIIENLEGQFSVAAGGGYSDQMTVYYFMTALIWDIVLKCLMLDAALSVFSVVLVFIYIWTVTGSGFLAVVGMSEILLSLPIAWFILRVIFQVKYFAGLNLMCIFIVCAVGADDIFVFMDAYVQSQSKGPNVNRDMETRFSWVYRKSGLAMLITSATTCAAFLCCLGTPLPDTQAFGIFAALVIAVDYILVITMYCTSVMVYHNRFEKHGFCSCNVPTPMGTCKCECCIEKCNCSKSDPSPTEKALTACTQHEVSREPDKMEQFFREKFAPLILHPKARIVILLVALAWLIPAIIFVFKLRPTTKPEQFLKSNHPFQKAINALNSNFGANSQDPGIDIYYVWGLKDLDRSGVNVLVNTSYLGNAQYADSFKFDTACQDKIYQICKDLKFDNTTSEYLNMIQRNKKAQGSVKCFLFDLKDSYLAENPGMSRDNPSRWAPAFMAGMVPEVDDEETTQMVSREQFYNERYMHMGWNGVEVRFVAISIEAKSITEWDEPAEDFMQSQYKMYDDLRHNMNHIAKGACGSEVLMTDGNGKWVFMNNQTVYRISSIRGALVGVAIALAVLLMCTRDVFISFLATLSILCTLLSVIGFVTMVGWELGSTEGILITILAGFAVDYVVHLAHAYSHNCGSSTERLTETFAEMGSPVFSGMCTSILASLPLFACNLQFFVKFGTFLCLTILFSWLFANFCFMGVLATIGRSKEKPAKK